MNNYAIKLVSTFIISTVLGFSSFSLGQQHYEQGDELIPEEETIGGIGGTGIRSMNRPEILDRPERIERPEILESRDAFEDSLEVDFPLDTGANEVEKPESIEN